MRFTVLNIFLTTIALIVFVYTGCSASICVSKNPIVFWIAIIGIIIVVVTWAILGMLEIGFGSRVEQAQFALKQVGENKNH